MGQIGAGWVLDRPDAVSIQYTTSYDKGRTYVIFQLIKDVPYRVSIVSVLNERNRAVTCAACKMIRRRRKPTMCYIIRVT